MNCTVKLTAWFLLLVFPATVMVAEGNAALLSGAGIVKVNDVQVAQSSTIYPGDKVWTGKDATAILTAKSAVMVLASDSVLLYEGRKLQVEQGRVLITTQPGTEVQFANLTITPQSPAKFQVEKSGSTAAVAALEGTLEVSDGAHQVILPGGKRMTRVAQNASQGSASSSSSSSSPSSGPVVAAKVPVIPGWAVDLIVVGAIGGVFGAVGAGAFGGGGGPASSSRP
jgi:hypothetical protein